jgi:hypothetical protein
MQVMTTRAKMSKKSLTPKHIREVFPRRKRAKTNKQKQKQKHADQTSNAIAKAQQRLDEKNKLKAHDEERVIHPRVC